MIKFILILTFNLCLFYQSGIFAKDVTFEQVLEESVELSAGDNIDLGENFSQAKFIKFLGKGNTTRVYEVEYDNQIMALRVPKSTGRFNTFSSYSDYIDAFYMGHDALKKQGVNIPEIYVYKEDNFLLVEKLKLDEGFELKDFFFYKDKIAPEEYNRAKDALDEFVRSIAPFKEIKDFHLQQAIFSPNTGKWILLDWTLNHEIFESTEDKHPLPISRLKSLWSDQVFFEKGGKDDNGRVPPLEVDQETKEMFENIDLIIQKERDLILEMESGYLNQLKLRLNDVTQVDEFLELINSTPEKHSKKYIESIIEIISKEERFKVDEILDRIPYYTIANNKDFEKLILSVIDRIEDLETLEKLLSLRLDKGLREDWKVTMKIQKLITSSAEDTPKHIYESLMNRKLVSNFAKAWIKRERLDIVEKQSCNQAIKSFL